MSAIDCRAGAAEAHACGADPPRDTIVCVIPVQAIVPRALAEIIRKAPLNAEKIAFAWRTAVGPAVAGATEIALDDHTLRVRARDRVWQRELERSAALIRTRLDDLLGAGVVRYIDVTAAAAGSRPRAAGSPGATGSAAVEPARKRPPSAGGSGSARRRR